MNREWLASRLVCSCALLLLSACAGDVGNEETTERGSAVSEEEYQPGRFQTQEEHIIPGWGSEGEGTGGSGLGGISGIGGIPPHGDPPLTGLGSGSGPYWVDSYSISSGTVYYPRGAPAPYVGLSVCGGFLNTGIEMQSWGRFYASWGIVTVVAWTGAFDLPASRGWALAAAVEELKGENSNPLSPLAGKMSGRYGTSGYSMGGGGSTVASASDPTLKASIGMAPWAPSGLGVQVPSLFICGDIDAIASCTTNAAWAYAETSSFVPKMLAMISGGHLDWFGPSAGWGSGGGLALAFAKVFLEGDERWKSLLLSDSHVVETNIF